ncbi:predicted protein [Lichtheimia corymbifera JMRC:FSU:9682]|uniref:AD domain-containing protein n=1 Tax=Lichtheimia corymbifera JMRC:FSU:9682 TaxID=1263082 RepID=A0A068RRR0_9FUNG|nr:predicted protein [Lichtheimia corymbifera JMRC:FSU:9682]
MSGNVVLLDCENTPPNARVIMHHAIASVHVDTERCLGVKTMDAILQRRSFVCDDPAWLKTRRDALIKYLEKHRVPFRQDENDPVIHVLGRARVEPPYVVTSVFCDNSIIGKRVQELVMKLG